MMRWTTHVGAAGVNDIRAGDWLRVLGRTVRPQGDEYEITFEVEKMTEPREDDLTDPAKQDPSPDLPSPEEGNDDEDDTDEKQDQQVG